MNFVGKKKQIITRHFYQKIMKKKFFAVIISIDIQNFETYNVFVIISYISDNFMVASSHWKHTGLPSFILKCFWQHLQYLTHEGVQTLHVKYTCCNLFCLLSFTYLMQSYTNDPIKCQFIAYITQVSYEKTFRKKTQNHRSKWLLLKKLSPYQDTKNKNINLFHTHLWAINTFLKCFN